MRSDSGRQSSSSESDGAEIVYSKDNVSIHPTQFASERISGRLKLIKQGSSLFMVWIWSRLLIVLVFDYILGFFLFFFFFLI